MLFFLLGVWAGVAGGSPPIAADSGMVVEGDGGTGIAVAAVDLNCDHKDDLVVGAYLADIPGPEFDRVGAGLVRVFFGDDDESAEILGAFTGDGAGFSLAGGDLNKDGCEDLAIGAANAQGDKGTTFVIFGRFHFPTELDLASNASVSITGLDQGDLSGISVAAGKTKKRDPVLVIGAQYASDVSAGETYVVKGPITTTSELVLEVEGTAPFESAGFAVGAGNDPITGVPGFDNFRGKVIIGDGRTLFGFSELDRFGSSISACGDIDFDGREDVLIGAPGVDSQAGAAYLFSGSTLVATVSGAAPEELLGWSVDCSGDVNGDHYPDILVGASDAGDENQGLIAVILGGYDGFPEEIDVSTFETSSSNNFLILGVEPNGYFGYSVATGDLNDDAADDIVGGAPGVNKAYVIDGEPIAQILELSFPQAEDNVISVPNPGPNTIRITITNAGEGTILLETLNLEGAGVLEPTLDLESTVLAPGASFPVAVPVDLDGGTVCEPATLVGTALTTLGTNATSTTLVCVKDVGEFEMEMRELNNPSNYRLTDNHETRLWFYANTTIPSAYFEMKLTTVDDLLQEVIAFKNVFQSQTRFAPGGSFDVVPFGAHDSCMTDAVRLWKEGPLTIPAGALFDFKSRLYSGLDDMDLVGTQYKLTYDFLFKPSDTCARLLQTDVQVITVAKAP
ncbi:hypothetical protein CTAYLR_003840 [Chrysophaeum taylorii]|uniref:FG-GAP repeat protein n=1 Tax=Chrysophaeum taylorii TaxID=2483200 RepID=A0AAD7UFP4_9STRA|nr:hypothetical protein CTAYLR_003840 [Chrysophaeum taylorii]